MSISHKGMESWNKGKYGINTGSKNNFYGKHHSISTKLKLGKFNLEQLKKIKKMINNKLSSRTIANIMGVEKTTILRIKNNETYKGVI